MGKKSRAREELEDKIWDLQDEYDFAKSTIMKIFIAFLIFIMLIALAGLVFGEMLVGYFIINTTGYIITLVSLTIATALANFNTGYGLVTMILFIAILLFVDQRIAKKISLLIGIVLIGLNLYAGMLGSTTNIAIGFTIMLIVFARYITVEKKKRRRKRQ